MTAVMFDQRPFKQLNSSCRYDDDLEFDNELEDELTMGNLLEMQSEAYFDDIAEQAAVKQNMSLRSQSLKIFNSLRSLKRKAMISLKKFQKKKRLKSLMLYVKENRLVETDTGLRHLRYVVKASSISSSIEGRNTSYNSQPRDH
ncbi:hypothetical protein L1987_15701 [Smallanthus sonchifolius]|uniref:Uncharacterized protein n=1 Tax=Smallanthus sonchifolius TaxID=185202 RepID=A0ACB9J8I3_9ASTR|nr:hypothetical protein L1987_15701 [Smallanthus sonchifolius]